MPDETLIYEIESLVNQHGTAWTKIGELLNENPERLRSLYRRHIKETDKEDDTIPLTSEDEEELNKASVIFRDKKHREAVEWRRFLDHAINAQEINDKLYTKQRTAHIHVQTDKPIVVVYTGDWHLGDGTTDHETWYRDIKTIMDHDNVYLMVLGDDYQNMRSFRVLSAVLHQVLSPTQQAAMMRDLVDELTKGNKLLAKVGGNHDEEFDERIFGEALQAYLYEKINAPIFPNRGLIELQVGHETYTNLLFHKSRFRSILRPAHGAYREWQLSYPAEVVAGAHDHQPAFEIFWSYTLGQDLGTSLGGEVFLIKVGTYQDSEFGYRYFHNGGFPVNPAVVYYPKEHKKLAFMKLEDAIQFLEGEK